VVLLVITLFLLLLLLLPPPPPPLRPAVPSSSSSSSFTPPLPAAAEDHGGDRGPIVLPGPGQRVVTKTRYDYSLGNNSTTGVCRRARARARAGPEEEEEEGCAAGLARLGVGSSDAGGRGFTVTSSWRNPGSPPARPRAPLSLSLPLPLSLSLSLSLSLAKRLFSSFSLARSGSFPLPFRSSSLSAARVYREPNHHLSQQHLPFPCPTEFQPGDGGGGRFAGKKRKRDGLWDDIKESPKFVGFRCR